MPKRSPAPRSGRRTSNDHGRRCRQEGLGSALERRQRHHHRLDHHHPGLRQVLERYQGSKARWVEIADQGATDEDLRAAIKEAMGTATSLEMPDGTPILYRGEDLAVWFDRQNSNGKPTLRGKDLIARVRDLYSIPKPSKKREAVGAK